jgi:hypothetical protein
MHTQSKKINNFACMQTLGATWMLYLAYKGFKAFLEGPLTWENYEQKVIDSYGNVMWNYHLFHATMMSSGFENIKKMISSISPSEYTEILGKVNDEKLKASYGTVTEKSNKEIQPVDEIDVYFILTPLPDFSGIVPGNGKLNAVISASYNPEKIPLILSHEYAHCLFTPHVTDYEQIKELTELTERLSEEKFNQLIAKFYLGQPLKFQIVNEGFASYFPRLISKSLSIYDALWAMPKDAVTRCMRNERLVKETIGKDLEERGMEIHRKYVMGGSWANPPKGLPEKTAYYVGYRIIENCSKNMSIKEICSSGVDNIISESRYFQ